MRLRAPSLAIVSVLAAAPAGGAELELGVEGSFSYDSNIFSSPVDEQDDSSLRLSPLLRARDQEGVLQWDVHYYPRYQKFVDLGDLDGWDHDAYGLLVWQIDERTRLRISDQYGDFASFNRLTDQAIIDGVIVDTGVELGRERSMQNVAELTLDHVLVPRHTLQFSASRYDNTFERADRSNSAVDILGGSYYYDLWPTTRVGLGARFTRQVVENPVANDESQSDFYNVSLGLQHRFDPTLSLEALVGPTWVEEDVPDVDPVARGVSRFPAVFGSSGGISPVRASSCPRLRDGTPIIGEGCEGFDAGTFSDLTFLAETTDLRLLGGPLSGDASDLTYFATIALIKRWSNFTGTLRYLRDASTAVEVSGQVREAISGNLTWQPSTRLRTGITVLYEMREQSLQRFDFSIALREATVNGVGGVGESIGLVAREVDRTSEINRLFVALFGRYQITTRTELFANFYWYREEFGGDLEVPFETDRFRVIVGVTYWFSPIRLPF